MRQFQIYLEIYCLDRSFNVIGQFMKKCCLLLFSISVVIGQSSSKWPGSSSCTVNYLDYLVT